MVALPEALRGVGIAELLDPYGLELESYGTARMMSRSANEVRQVIGTVDAPDGAGNERVLLECLPSWAGAELEAVGLSLSEGDQSTVAAGIGVLRQARHSVHTVWPELSSSIGCLVRCLHLLKAPSSEVDCSYSRPDLPFSVFLSVPDRGARARIERLAEALVHETMHLQLSLIERQIPLIESGHAKTVTFSPWRGGVRHVRGVLHGLYVFVVVQRLWQRVARRTSCGLDREFAEARVRAVHDEVRKTRQLAESPGLSQDGRQLVRQLLALGGAPVGGGPSLHHV